MTNATVATGLDVIQESTPDVLRGARVGLLAHPASVDARLNHAVDIFMKSSGFKLAAIFGPQHGYLGNTQDNMIEWMSFRDPRTGLPVHSLYSMHRKPAPEMLGGIDALVCDIQDVGTRVYTFVWTVALCMEACAEAGKPLVILDRPNPIGGAAVEGNVLDPEFRSFVGLHPVPMRHGMTTGELAAFVNDTAQIGCDLRVVTMRNWRRDMQFEDTRLPWVMPSPNMPTPDTARVYPGTVIFEGANISEGRGATRPFELIGAPWLDAHELAGELDALELPGVRFRPAFFEPTFHKSAGRICAGVQIHVTDIAAFKPFITGIAILKAARNQSPINFEWKQPPYEYEYEKLPIDMIFGTGTIRKQIESNASLEEIESKWQPGLIKFMEARSKYLLYEK